MWSEILLALNPSAEAIEAIMRDQERRFVMENIKKSDTGETQSEKPRICQVLGGKDSPLGVGEEFDVRGYEDLGPFHIDEHGRMVYRCGGTDTASDEAIYAAISHPDRIISHPDRIIRKPHFTEEEVADAKVLARALLANGFERDRDGDVFVTSSVACWTLLDSRMFPSLERGQSIRIQDIIDC